jgi:hypothetical protein
VTRFVLLTSSFLGVLLGVTAPPEAPKFDAVDVRIAQPVLPPVIKRKSPEEILKPHLAWAEQESRKALSEPIRKINAFFANSKRNTRGFAEVSLGWGSKWRLMADHVPFTSGARHEAFIRTKFEEYVFEPAQLEAAMKEAVSSYLKQIESIEGQMLVRVRTDMADLPESAPIAKLDAEQIQAAYQDALTQVLKTTHSNMRADIATELVSLITGEVLTQVAVRLGVSAGILGTGAATSWATVGIGLVVGLIVDQIVSWVWESYANPKGNLAEALDRKLDDINHMIVEGAPKAPGLRERLQRFAIDRSTVREKAILSLFQPQLTSAAAR